MYAHAVIHVAHVNGAVLADRQVVSPINLPVIVSEAAPFGEDFSGKVEFEKLSAIGGVWFQVASINDVKEIVRADGQGPGAAKLWRTPHFQEFAVAVEDLNARVAAIRDVDQSLRIHGDAVRQIEFAGSAALVAPIEQELAAG